MTARHAYTLPHVLRIATGMDVHGLNPHVNAQTVGTALAMGWLLKTGSRNEPVPELATVVPTRENGSLSRDGRTITYHLRRGVVWSDGAPFDARDVLFSVRTILNPANAEITRSGWDDISSVSAPDRYTIVFRLKRPNAAYAYTYFSSQGEGSNPCLLPRHLLNGLPNINDARYNALPVGIGPFEYVRWRRAEFVELAANERYFRGPPKLRRVVFESVPNRNTLLAGMQTHDVDLWPNVTSSYLPRLESIAGVRIGRTPGSWIAKFDLNLAHPALRDRAVRAALQLALDRAALLRLRRGLGVVQDGLISPGNPAFDPAIPTTPFDLRRANALLDRARWIRGDDGVRRKAGVRLELDVATGLGTPDSDAMLELVRQWWSQIGVAINLRRYTAPAFFGSFADRGVLATGRFDVANYSSAFDAIGDLSPSYACDQIPPAGQNVTRYCDPAVDAALRRFRMELSFAARRPYANFIQARLARDVPTIVLGVYDHVVAFNSDLVGLHPNQLSMYDDFMHVDI